MLVGVKVEVLVVVVVVIIVDEQRTVATNECKEKER